MTDFPSSQAPRLPYVSPALTSIGTIEAVTAGPQNGSLDQIIGGSGGFQSDATS